MSDDGQLIDTRPGIAGAAALRPDTVGSGAIRQMRRTIAMPSAAPAIEPSAILAGALDAVAEGVMVLDHTLRVRFQNRPAATHLGIRFRASAPWPNLERLLSASGRLDPADRSRLLRHCADTVAGLARGAERLELGAVTAQLRLIASRRWVLLLGQAMPAEPAVVERAQAPTPDPQPAGAGSAPDAVGGWPDREEFHNALNAALAMTPGDVGLLMFSLRGLRQINETLGPAIGDGLLAAIDARVRAVLPARAFGRLAANEFALLLPEAAGSGPASAARCADRLIEAGGRSFLVQGHPLSIGVHAGLALAPEDGETGDALLRAAHLALADARAQRQDGWRRFDAAMGARALAVHERARDLRLALPMHQLELHYQPQIAVATGRLNGFEALLRWRHPRLGLVPPNDFIPLAEESGLIVAIGAWVLRTACAEAQRWPAPLRVAVNVSPLQLAIPDDLLQVVQEALASSGLDARRLELEVTETAVFDSGAGALAALRALKAMGVRISIDDFGVGYSSLSRLRDFPFDTIKIDRSFVRDLPDSRSAISLIAAITTMATGLHMSTTAEGVETESQAQTVAEYGCSDVQGYLYGRPAPAAEVAATIARLSPGLPIGRT